MSGDPIIIPALACTVQGNTVWLLQLKCMIYFQMKVTGFFAAKKWNVSTFLTSIKDPIKVLYKVISLFKCFY